jgi:glycosyltransferase involved in cell wall biosynthesis
MKVLHILNELRFSGAEVMLKTAAPFWQERGIQGDILAKREEVGLFKSKLEDAGYEVIHQPYRDFLSFAPRYYQLLTSRSYDAVHIHTEHLNFWMGLLSVAAGVPVVLRTVHSAFLHGGKTRLKRLVQRTLLRQIGVAHISIGPSVKRAEQEFLYNPTNIIPDWYDSRSFVPPSNSEIEEARGELGVPDDVFVIVSVGNCSEQKNHSAILRAIDQIEEEHLFYLHAGEEQHDRYERELARQLGIRDQVRFLGAVENVKQVLYASDVYVMPSHREGLGIAALEAAGTGRVCVLADSPGLRDLSGLGCGIIMTQPNPDSLARSVQRVRSMSEKERRQKGRKLAEEARSQYGIEQGARQYAMLYQGESSPRISPAS